MNNTLKTTLITYLNELIVLADEMIVEEQYRMQETKRKWQEYMAPSEPLREFTDEAIWGSLRANHAERQKKLSDLVDRGDSTNWIGRFTEWKTNSENLILYIVGANSFQYENFRGIMNAVYETRKLVKGRGILNALKMGLERGLLGSIENPMHKRMFTDVLTQAQHLLEKGYEQSAISLGGVVLENGLKRLAERAGIQIGGNSSIGALNKRLAEEGVYNESVRIQVDVWRQIRNVAAHESEESGKYNATNVKNMLESIQIFLTEHLG